MIVSIHAIPPAKRGTIVTRMKRIPREGELIRIFNTYQVKVKSVEWHLTWRDDKEKDHFQVHLYVKEQL